MIADVKAEALKLTRLVASDQEDSIKNTRQLLFALAQLSEVRAVDPGNVTINGLLGISAYQVGEWQLAINFWGRALESLPPGGSSMKGMNLSGKPGIVQPMQMPPTFGQPPIPSIHPRLVTLQFTTGPQQPIFTWHLGEL